MRPNPTGVFHADPSTGPRVLWQRIVVGARIGGTLVVALTLGLLVVTIVSLMGKPGGTAY